MDYYSITAHDNDSFLIDLANNPFIKRCSKCNQILNKEQAALQSSKTCKIKKKTLDLSVTYDGFYIASYKFKVIYESNNWGGLEFIDLPMSPNFYWIRVINSIIIQFDGQKASVEFINSCYECGEYTEVIGAYPVYLKKGEADKMKDGEFYRTDLVFGADHEKSPLIIVSEGILRILELSKTKGIEAEKAQQVK